MPYVTPSATDDDDAATPLPRERELRPGAQWHQPTLLELHLDVVQLRRAVRRLQRTVEAAGERFASAAPTMVPTAVQQRVRVLAFAAGGAAAGALTEFLRGLVTALIGG